jgi:hypothetical protein
MTPLALCLPPALPSELLSYVLAYQSYPTTILICSSREDFLTSLTEGLHQQPEEALGVDSADLLLVAPLYQVAVARHISIAFIPSVTHLRAYLSVFTPSASNVPPPPNRKPSIIPGQPPQLVVYRFLELHRDTSEWSAQGISSSASTLVEAGRRTRFQPVIVEPRPSRRHIDDSMRFSRQDLTEQVPLLRGSAKGDDGEWTGRTVDLQRIIGRWFRIQAGEWTTT